MTTMTLHTTTYAATILSLLISTTTTTMAQSVLELRDGDRVVFVGDSITQNGQYPNLLECYLLEKYPTLKFTFRNAAWNSDRAWLHMRTADKQSLSGDAMLKLPAGEEQEKMRAAICAHGLSRDILPLKPTVVTIMYGANDIRDGENALELHIRSLRQLITTLREVNCRVILLSPSPEESPEWNAKHEIFMVAVKKMVDEEKVPYIDVFHPVQKAVEAARTADPTFAYTTDGIHPRQHGHVMIAEALLQGLGFTDPKLNPSSPLLPKVTEKNKTYFHRWREVQVPAMVAGKIDSDDARAALAADDKRIAELEAEIDVLRKRPD